MLRAETRPGATGHHRRGTQVIRRERFDEKRIPPLVLTLLSAAALGAIIAGVANRLNQPDFRYEAVAVITPERLLLNPARVPRTTAALVRAGARNDPALADPRLDVRPLEEASLAAGTRILIVTGSGNERRDAVELAQLGAEKVVDLLNETGPLLGTFRVLEPATRAAPTVAPNLATDLALGIAAGLFVHAAVVTLARWSRRTNDPLELVTSR